MYRLMQPSDEAAVVALWQKERGDSAEFIKTALEKFAGAENIYVAEENDEIVAAALAVPVTLKGRSGSYSINHQQSGRDLMTPDEVRLLDNSKCILFIRGERPVIDLKYNLLKHPNIRYTDDGGAAPYDYTAADNARDDLPGAPENYELLDMDDFLPAEAAEMKPTIQRIRRST